MLCRQANLRLQCYIAHSNLTPINGYMRRPYDSLSWWLSSLLKSWWTQQLKMSRSGISSPMPWATILIAQKPKVSIQYWWYLVVVFVCASTLISFCFHYCFHFWFYFFLMNLSIVSGNNINIEDACLHMATYKHYYWLHTLVYFYVSVTHFM